MPTFNSAKTNFSPPANASPSLENLKKNRGWLSPEINRQKQEAERRIRWFHRQHNLEKEELAIYDRRNREIKLEIAEIRREIKKLARAITEADGLSAKISGVADQPTAPPSLYELGFWQKISQKLKKIRASIENSSLWLKENKSRKKKKNFWSMVNSKKGGAKNLLSSEHYVSRSAG